MVAAVTDKRCSRVSCRKGACAYEKSRELDGDSVGGESISEQGKDRRCVFARGAILRLHVIFGQLDDLEVWLGRGLSDPQREGSQINLRLVR